MKIKSIRMKNLRSVADETINLNDYTCLVGPNGAGKSTVLLALNIFFREATSSSADPSSLVLEDFHQKNPKEPIQITITFEELSPDAQKEFENYYRHGNLVISAMAHFNEASGKAEVKQYGQRLGMAEFREFFKAVGDGVKVGDLKKIYEALREKIELPPPGTKDGMISALHEYEANHPDLCELQLSEDQFYGVSRGVNRLANFVQWVYVPAVKDASTEQIEARDTALGKLLARTVRAKTNFSERIRDLQKEAQDKYQSLLDESQHVLVELSKSLETRLIEWAHPDARMKLEWRQDPQKSVRMEEPLARIIAGDGEFSGEIVRFGHGLQRSYLLALLHELAMITDAEAPRLILGCEEPELYQHPPQARHLASVLQALSENNAQIIVSTHSPMFVSGEAFEDVRLVRKDYAKKCTSIAQASYADIANDIAAATGDAPKKPEGVLAKINQALQPHLNEMFFCNRLVLVEGFEDVAYLSACTHLMGTLDEFRKTGCHIVPVNGKSELIQALAIAKRLAIPTYLMFDSDADKPDKNGSRAKHEKDNRALLALANQPKENPMPVNDIWGAGFVMWKSDIGATVESEIGKAEWQEYSSKADARYGNAGGLKKNTLHIGAALALAWADGKKAACLERVCSEILDLANRVS